MIARLAMNPANCTLPYARVARGEPAAECVLGLPTVFDPDRRPWIEPEQAAADAIAGVVAKCPTGALHFERLDDGPQEPQTEEITINPRLNGPLYVRGHVRIVGPGGALIREDTRMALCRCGASTEKPFCDGTHSKIGFKAAEKAVAESKE